MPLLLERKCLELTDIKAGVKIFLPVADKQSYVVSFHALYTVQFPGGPSSTP